MKLVREHINFERGKDPLDSMGIGQYNGRKPGQILIDINPSLQVDNGPFRRFCVFVEEEQQDKSLSLYDTVIIQLGYIAGNPPYAHIGLDTPFMGKLWKPKKTLRYPNKKEQEIIQKALNKEQYQKYIDRATEIIGVKPFV